ncbi:MAG: cation transporter [Deltaproteobacteria bacterium]|nr:cation transporter [Deltaproteobacteria bacterium]
MEPHQVTEKCNACRDRSGYIQVAATVSLALIKLVVGLLGNSKALLADAIHSTANILTGLGIFISKKWSLKPADEDHPYGHGKVEFVVSGVISGLIVLGAIFLLIASVKQLLVAHPPSPPNWYVIVVAAISVLVNELLYGYLTCLSEKFNSATYKTSAWAIRADSFTSIAVIIGVIGSKLGFVHLDAIIALIVIMIIIFACGKCMFEAIFNLMDKNISAEGLKEIGASVAKIKGFKVTELKARLNGTKVWVHLEIVMPDHTPLDVFNETASKIKEMVIAENKNIQRVDVTC